ncbi:MAG: GIY-YIG nuclease family protein [Pseudomonadota bacterium]
MDKGIYNLIIYLGSDKLIPIGKLGSFLFKKGYYIYTGSAKKGLKARVERHKRRGKAIHWHIDYLLEEATIIDVKVSNEESSTECRLNERIFQIGGAELVTPGFGASDCKCRSHLAYFRELPEVICLKRTGGIH